MELRPNFIQDNVALAPLTTYQIGGPAQYFARVGSLNELSLAVQWAKANGLPVHFLGGGSNLLISDDGVTGLVISLTAQTPQFIGEIVEVGAGYSLSKLVADSLERGLAGLEWAAGIPGQIGGAVRGNAGAFGGWMADHIVEVAAYNSLTNQLERFDLSACQFSYRHSLFKGQPELLIWSIKLSLTAGNRDDLQKIAQEHRDYRLSRHPRLASAGCVFKNLVADEVAIKAPALLAMAQTAGAVGRGEVPAGFVIAQAGLAGHAIGSAQVSSQHANFLVNNGGATSQEMRELIGYVQSEVKRQYNLELIPEVARWP